MIPRRRSAYAIPAWKSNDVHEPVPATLTVPMPAGTVALTRAIAARSGRYSGLSWSAGSAAATAAPTAIPATATATGARRATRADAGRGTSASAIPSASHTHMPAGTAHHNV